MVLLVRQREYESSASASASKSKGRGKSIEEDYEVIDHLGRGSDSSSSSGKSKGKGKGKEEEYDVIDNPKNIEDEIAAIDHQIDALNERKSELRGTVLLDKLDELHKKIRDLAGAVAENVTSTRKQALGRSGVDSAGERSPTRTGRPSRHGGSGSRELPYRYRRRQRENVRASDWERVPGYGHYHSQHDGHDASVWGHVPEHGYYY